MKLSFIISTFFVFFFNCSLSPTFASTLVEESRPHDRMKTKASPKLTKRKSKTLPSDPFSLLLPNASSKSSKYATIGTSSTLKESSRSKNPSFVMPTQISSQDVFSLFEGKKVKIAGRQASLVRIEQSQEEIERSQQLIDELKKNKLHSAILIKSIQFDGQENIKKSALKIPSGQYSLYDTLKIIMPNVTLTIKFSKIKKEDKKVTE